MPLRQSFCSIFSLLFLTTLNPEIAQAQVVPDGTLPTVVDQSGNIYKITDGEKIGNNLFHSFEQFSIPQRMEAIFENGLDIENIFTRVTGTEVSFIDGLLKTSGGANLFLMNPNGIVFGENARLDIGGSFLATTGNSIEFEDGNTFAVNSNNPNVSISITLPVGVNFNGGNGSIIVNGGGNQISNDSNFLPIQFRERPTGISVKNNQTLALIGNEIKFDGGIVTAKSGNIFLMSVETGTVQIERSINGLTFLDNGVTKYQDINLNQQSLIDASGEKVGTVSVIGKNINFSNASALLLQNQGDSSSGSINLKAIESLAFSGTSSDGDISSLIRSEALNMGEGADIDIFARRLTIQDRSTIQASTFSDTVEAIGGNINLNISERVKLDGGLIAASTLGKGNAGNLQLSTPQLELNNSGLITSATVGTGNGGKVIINADFIELDGGTASSINRTNISASSLLPNSGNAGDITITSEKLRIINGASLSSSSFAIGNAGDIIINASEFVEVKGINQDFQESNTPQSIIRSAVQVATPARQERLGLPEVPSGNAGNLTINTPLLNLSQEVVVSVENQGTGSAGKLTINADNLNLDESAKITAAAQSGIGGDILLNTQNLNISDNSQITSAANGSENGGNITINTQNLTAKKNTEITANTFKGDGGNIEINGSGSISLNNNDEITARSELGDGGNIKITSTRLQLDNSRISASAGGEGNGGNVTINTDVFTAVDNSGVTATAVGGDGGNVEINTTGYFVSDDFVVSASSEFGLDGTVEINVNEQALQEIFILSDYPLISLQEILAKSCLTKQGRIANATRINSLGRGALPISPSTGIDLGEDIPMQKVHVYTEKDWQPGEPLIQVEKFVTTAEGKRLGVAEVKIPQRCLN